MSSNEVYNKVMKPINIKLHKFDCLGVKRWFANLIVGSVPYPPVQENVLQD